jgi:uncharacterized protein YecT (DUF1311 family)
VVLVAASLQAHAGPNEAAVLHFSKLTKIPPEDVRRDFDACDGTTAQMMTCLGYRWAVEDLALNSVYRSARAVADSSGYAGLLVDAQRLWIKYRDSSCDFEAKLEAAGGSAEPLARYVCMARLTKVRTRDLERVATDYPK